MLAVHPCSVDFVPPPSRARAWTREEALVELLRGRMTLAGPTTARELARSLCIAESEADAAMIALESEGSVLRGSFTGSPELEWCDRRLLARIHRYTLNRLRAEIEPVSPADFTRFLFAWQHVTNKLTGIDGLRAVLHQLDGFEAPAAAWERSVLPARVDRYDPSLLDLLSLSGEFGWAQISSGIALFPREHCAAWLSGAPAPSPVLSDAAQGIIDLLRARGASFLEPSDALDEVVNAGLITSDGFIGRRSAGRWSLLPDPAADVDVQARAFLRRHGIVFRRMLTRESNAAPWRELARVYRRLEARGEIRGGRFVNGMSGEQFALPEAVERLREIRRAEPDGKLIVISAADPLNLAGILTPDERVRAIPANRIAYRDGVAVSVMEGDFLRLLTSIEPTVALEAATALAGRRVPVSSGFVGRA
jgi:ATP-dependent Lhr-like helicase